MIERNPRAAAEDVHDLVVVGGGVHGTMIALEAARRGLEPLLLERSDFGGATSWNSLRIAHGGLRYLQSLDLGRFRESVGERRWLLERFPDLVEPLPCLMPLYGRGLRRPVVFRVALLLNHLLSWDRNRDLAPERRLPPGEVLDPAETRARFPAVRQEGLRGGALWYDASIRSTARLLLEALRWSCASGARCLNYVEARELRVEEGIVRGVDSRDRARGEEVLFFRAPVVVNAAGPWAPAVARAFGSSVPDLYPPSIAFNLLLDREPPSEACVAVEPEGGGRTYFLRPWRGKLLAGTWHGPWKEGPDRVGPGEERIEAFLEDLRRCAPAFDIAPEEVIRVYAGLMPAAEEGTAELATRDVLHDHGAVGGPRGLYSVAGVKYTTARSLAERLLRRIYGERLPPVGRRGPSPTARPAVDEERAHLWEAGRARDLHRDDPERLRRLATTLAREEAVVTLDDLLLRRTEWWMDAREAPEVAAFLRGALREADVAPD